MEHLLANLHVVLQVAPCFLPTGLAGAYWVVAFDVDEAWALVSGGAPTHPGTNGTCRTGTGVNGSGLWIFTRRQQRDPSIVSKVRAVASAKGFDLSVLVVSCCRHRLTAVLPALPEASRSIPIASAPLG